MCDNSGNDNKSSNEIEYQIIPKLADNDLKSFISFFEMYDNVEKRKNFFSELSKSLNVRTDSIIKSNKKIKVKKKMIKKKYNEIIDSKKDEFKNNYNLKKKYKWKKYYILT